MSVFDQVARVREAQLRMGAARQDLSTPAAALLMRGHRHPLTTVGVAAAAGFHDQAHLTRHFKRLLATTPGRYQRSAAAA